MRNSLIVLAWFLSACGYASAQGKPETDKRSNAASVNVCELELLPSPKTVAQIPNPDVKGMLRLLEGPAPEACPAAAVVVSVHGSPAEVVQMLLAIRAHVRANPVSSNNERLIVGGVLNTGYNLRFNEADFAKTVIPVLAEATSLSYWSNSKPSPELLRASTPYSAATAAISALGYTGIPASMSVLKGLLARPTLEADYNSATIRVEVLDAAECALRQSRARKPGMLPIATEDGE